MTPERIAKFFESELGQQCPELYSTPDDRVFIRLSEAEWHCRQNNLDEDQIQMWFPEWGGNDPEPKYRT